MVFADNCTVRLKQTLTVTLRCGGRVAGAPVCKTYVRKWRVQAISACGYFVDERTGHSGQLPEGRQGRGQAVQPGPLHRPPPRPGVQAGGNTVCGARTERCATSPRPSGRWRNTPAVCGRRPLCSPALPSHGPYLSGAVLRRRRPGRPAHRPQAPPAAPEKTLGAGTQGRRP